jgi:hypothetical protein
MGRSSDWAFILTLAWHDLEFAPWFLEAVFPCPFFESILPLLHMSLELLALKMVD